MKENFHDKIDSFSVQNSVKEQTNKPTRGKKRFWRDVRESLLGKNKELVKEHSPELSIDELQLLHKQQQKGDV